MIHSGLLILFFFYLEKKIFRNINDDPEKNNHKILLIKKNFQLKIFHFPANYYYYTERNQNRIEEKKNQ